MRISENMKDEVCAYIIDRGLMKERVRACVRACVRAGEPVSGGTGAQRQLLHGGGLPGASQGRL